MTFDEQLKHGADKLIALSARTSTHEPYLAIGQLLLSAAMLGKTVGMTEADFVKGCDLARGEMWDD